MHSNPIFLLVVILTGVFVLVAVVAGVRLRAAAPSRSIALIAVLPALTMLGLFYSLAIHMYSSLGGWPGIGTEGFPVGLSIHAHTASWLFGSLFLGCIFLWPIAAIVTLLVKRFRQATPYLGIFAASCLVCFAATMLAPSGFLYWWWD